MNVFNSFCLLTVIIYFSNLNRPEVLAKDKAEDRRKPNVIILFTDDQGYADLGVHGSKLVLTPNIDSLAKNGMRFKGGYVTAPQCGPSRAGILTGQYQQKFAMESNAAHYKSFGLPTNISIFPEYMKKAGYVTAGLGKWHLGAHREGFYPGNRGFDWTWCMPGSSMELNGKSYPKSHHTDTSTHNTEKLTVGACDFISKNKNKPFFMYLAYHVPHAPYRSVDKWMNLNKHIKDKNKRILAGMISELDSSVGRIINTLKAHKLEEDTIIFFISDNGAQLAVKYPHTVGSNDPLKGKKGTLYEGGIRVPWIVQWKGHIKSGQVSDEAVSTLDLLPTALSAAGNEDLIVKDMDGVNLLPFFTGKSKAIPKRPLFFRWMGWLSMREGDWMIVRPVEKGKEISKYELYKLSNDFKETKDLAEQNPEIVDRMRDQLLKWNNKLTAPGWISKEQNTWLNTVYGKQGMTPYKAKGFTGVLPNEKSSKRSKKNGARNKAPKKKK
jgi:arylsulfatase A-like enzyme